MKGDIMRNKEFNFVLALFILALVMGAVGIVGAARQQFITRVKLCEANIQYYCELLK